MKVEDVCKSHDVAARIYPNGRDLPKFIRKILFYNWIYIDSFSYLMAQQACFLNWWAVVIVSGLNVRNWL